MANKLLLIGIDEYQYQKKLNSCVKDVLDLKNILLEKFYFTETDIYEITNLNATNKKIQDALRGYVKTTSHDDNLIIFFSGHGSYDEHTNTGYWVPVDGSDYSTWLSNETLITFLDNIKCKHIFIISDSCFSNSLLITQTSKDIVEFDKHDSRWALTSAYENAMDSDGITNTLFAETIISYLENASGDVRVSELIEDVKRNFLDNKMQQPQGHPLRVKGHKGGEFIFKIKQSIDNRKFKGYPDFKSVLRLYKRNSIFTELANHEDRTNKIGFQLYQEVDSVIKKATYYLYLYEGMVQNKTLNYLNENHTAIFKDKNLLIFFPKEKDKGNTESRKKNIFDKFKPINIFYIDDFIREQCTPRIINDDIENFLNISNFVIPVFNKETDESKVNLFVNNWYSRESEPILVIKGAGGIGKTTFSQYVSDKIKKINPTISVLFIDSMQIKDSLLKNKNHDGIKLYNFYEALYDITETIPEKLSEELFYINIDAGNILVVIDGLDEVISKIPNFNVANFLGSINDTYKEIGSGKIIITCRTFFWDQTQFASNELNVIELEPFTENQMTLFFSKSFNNDSQKIKRGIKLAEEFRYPDNKNEYIYHPYVLDIIRSIIDTDKSALELDLSLFSSEILDNNIKNDYIIYRVCDREIRRVGQISVDNQIRFFIYLATEKRGIIKIENLKEALSFALDQSIDSVNVEAFKSHPFLKLIETNILFKYDFLADVFKSIYISSFFDFENVQKEISTLFFEIVIENCWFGSALNQDIVNRVQHWDEGDILLVSDIIEKINKSKIISSKKQKLIANIFNLSLTIMHRKTANNIENNTLLLKNLFETSQNNLEGLAIIDINTDRNVRMDFSSLSIKNSIIDNFSTFWECNFSEETKFINCNLLNLKFEKNNSVLKPNNFIDCTYDSEVEFSIKALEDLNQNKTEQMKSFLSAFFHLFISNGRLGRQWEEKVIKPRYKGINKYNIEYKKVIRLMKKYDFLIVTQEMGKAKFEIKTEAKEDVLKFIKDGTISSLVGKFLSDLI